MSKALDTITDKVLVYSPEQHPLKVVAGTPDAPLRIGDIEIPCYVLEDETRVLSQGGFVRAIGRTGGPKSGHEDLFNLPVFLRPRNLARFIPEDLSTSSRPIQFRALTDGSVATGYRATLLPEVCEVFLSARQAGVLHPTQYHIAERAEILIRGLAQVGIIALVDEATGYQRIREERSLAIILERFIAKELQPWTRTFPYVFYEQIFRLKGWGRAEGVNPPSVVGHYTNDLVYERLGPGVLEELRRQNPTLPQGWRRNRHHQWFTPEYGHPRLKEHLEGVTALMRAATSWAAFKRSIDRVYPKLGNTIPLAIGDDLGHKEGKSLKGSA